MVCKLQLMKPVLCNREVSAFLIMQRHMIKICIQIEFKMEWYSDAVSM